jgi:hypothetical protein
MIGLEKGIVKLSEFDENWASYFNEEKERILKVAFPRLETEAGLIYN